ncbi:MAG: hypothetical protein ACF8NJ_00960 [Phycisphaerales bacterium JB038]
MRALLLTDRDFTIRENPMVERLAVGLMAAGVSVARAAPEAVAPWRESGLSPRATYRDGQLPWAWTACARELLERLSAAGWGAEPIDIVHVFGRGAWRLGFAVARAAGATIALEIWSNELAARLPGSKGRAEVGAYNTPSQALAVALRSQVDPNLVSHLPWGVLAIADADFYPPLSELEKSISVVVIASGKDLPACRSCLGGLAALTPAFPQLCVFLAAPEEAAGRLHALCQELGLDGIVSLVPLDAAARGLELQADLLVIPEALGEHRSFCLQAIANGRIVVAVEDRVVDYLREETVTLTVRPAKRKQWQVALEGILRLPTPAREQAQQAREVVRERYTASGQVAGLASLSERRIKGDTITFEPESP